MILHKVLRPMRALQALVVFQGILIVGGLILLVVLMIFEPKHASPRPVVAAATPTAPASIAIPPGFRVTEMVATSDRVVIRLDGRDGAQSLLVLDPVSGVVTRSLATGVVP